ncbi:MAG: 30S ribosomal protein S20 [Gammaproteobacteria bacterium]|nr:30S ribosomal protein S20 [Gammaproteobacteria bacterium]
MANSAQAKKRARQAANRHEHNAGMRSMFRTYVKKVVYAIEAGDKAKAEDAYKAAVPIIDGICSKGLIHKNKAARHKSRLNQRVRSMA